MICSLSIFSRKLSVRGILSMLSISYPSANQLAVILSVQNRRKTVFNHPRKFIAKLLQMESSTGKETHTETVPVCAPNLDLHQRTLTSCGIENLAQNHAPYF